MRKKERISQRVSPLDEIERVRKSAYNGAASFLAPGREDLAEEIAAETREKYIKHCRAVAENGARPIKSPSSWGFAVGKHAAMAWIKDEQKYNSISISPSQSGEDSEYDSLNRHELLQKSPLGGREEILDALPELFDMFQRCVINQLSREDRLFYERYYNDNWSEEQIAVELNISPKAVAQRWRRLLVKMRRNLLRELPKWNRGNELFAEPFRDPKSLVGLLCLIRLFFEQGIDALRELVSSFNGK